MYSSRFLKKNKTSTLSDSYVTKVETGFYHFTWNASYHSAFSASSGYFLAKVF
jgi:hypothetical protein